MLNLDPQISARRAGLVYIRAETSGYRRLRAGRGFRYVGPLRRAVKEPSVLRRIRSLVIPPAWREVWICKNARGHLQATGFDARGRKQYRYHPKWTSIRGDGKYQKIIDFGRKLPAIRARVRRDMQRPGLPREKVLATIVRLLEVSLIRVGNEEYARENKSFGLTTMKDQHVEISGEKLHFHFRGKSGIEHSIDLRDPKLAKIVKRCQAVAGPDLFQYLDAEGNRRSVDSTMVNGYLHEIAGEAFTAKDFRTWAGTVLAARALREFESFDSQAQAKRNISRAIESVAAKLGNTKAVCRKCYIHPAVLNSYLDGKLAEMLSRKIEVELRDRLKNLRAEEATVLAFLHNSLTPKQRKKR